ncbi:proline/serine-rich coiled-coil protein 1 isoform X2 [Falco rusticolus]|uniref:proline/serine-rich coiled-coil protein 1 isoform X2 n=1 Tax=Falco rusticolus TaxID=120794 RepID=UPI0018868538|nr:proline/serine-rich coiled-coil protein 1 isoform X2 [Falco rusticolus]
MAEEGAETLRWGLGSPPEAAPALAPWAEAEAMAEERDVRFVTEESFDFGLLSPSDSQEEEEDEGEAGARAGGGSGRWSPLHGARLEEMVREATRLAAQLEQCHLSPSARHGPRSPRRETFVVKDSPVRALLPTVEPRGPPPATTRPPAKPRGAPTATTIPSTRKVSPSCHPTAVPKGPPGARVPPPQPAGPPSALPCPGAGGCSPGQVRAPPGGDSRPAKGEGGRCPLPPRHPPAPHQGHHRPRPLQPPPCPQRHPQGTWTDPGGGGCTGWEGTRGQRCGGGTGSPPGHWLRVQTRTCPQPPPPPQEDGDEQHPEVTPPPPPEELGVPVHPPSWCMGEEGGIWGN